MDNNPYIIGTPIETPELLFGRDSLFEQIRDHLENNIRLILLHGQRRIGKSSVLNILPSVVARDEFLFISYDLQNDTSSEKNIILHKIISNILHELGIDQEIDISYLETNSNLEDRTVQRTIYEICYVLHQKNLKLILLLDEFDVIENDNNIGEAVNFLEYLNNLIRNQIEIYLIAVVGRYLNSVPNLVQMFREAPLLEIGLLNNESAKKLITQPAIKSLQYRDETIEKILKFSSGHPLYTQVLCHELFNFARNQNNNSRSFTIVSDDVDKVISEALETSHGGCACFWDGLSLHEKVVVSTLAQAQQEKITGNPKEIYQEYGLVLTDALQNAISSLINKGFLNSNPIKIKVEIVRLWLLIHHQLRDEIAILERTEDGEFNKMLEIARSFWLQKDKQENALIQYKEALKLNPNNFILIVELAEKYCELKDFEQALLLYKRAYKLNKLVYKQRFIEALDHYGSYLLQQEYNEKAKEQYEKILQIDPENSSAREKIGELRHMQIDSNEIAETLKESDSSGGSNFGGWLQRIIQPKLWKILGYGGLIAGLIAFAMIFFINKQKNCAADQQKNPQGVCVTNSESLSSGDRSLFSQITNNKLQDIDKFKFKENKQKGITNFQQKKYLQAAEDFKQAVKYNSNDPEVLIYQNNSLARQKGEPFVLAVVVPATHQSNYVLAWEILRGIAQAQDEFNQNQGLNGRLLEILIADDGDSKIQARKVAQQIANNNSVLGVIGHNASGVTNEALPIYEQAKIPIISSTSTSIDLKSSVFFRTLPSDKETGNKLAEYAIKKGLKQVLVLCNPDESYSRSIKEEFRTNLGPNGEVIGGGCINIANKNVDSQILDNLPNPKTIQAVALFPDTQHLYEAIKIAKKYKKINSEISLLGGDSVYVDDIFSKGGDDIEGLVLAVPWFRETKKSQTFAQNAKKQWGGDVSWRTATSYDAVKAFLDSIDKSINSSQTLSRDTVINNLKKVEVQKTSFGETLKFNVSQESQRKVVLLKVKNRQFITEEEQTKEEKK
ncbi:MAG: ABC transporter substrate-binding protein [Desmonostoc vinosum HA7617-LM4]|jgi:ABC-type branched-subunit amino acid transport system substrate-binding protein|nr:ABC transporter substrate-binding protein [Desmonostoc vinosum HA7617-LM4]